MKKIIFIFIMLLCTMAAHSQKTVALHHNGTVVMFAGTTPFIDAYNAASNLDTIYLPGGVFSTVDMDKQLAIYGAGHYPDSSMATGKTVIANTFTINSNADSLLLEGIEFNAGVFIGATVNHLKFKRNIFQGITYNALPASSYSRFEGNVIRGNTNINYSNNTMFVNNIIIGSFAYAKNGDVLRNNIFMAVSYPISSCSYALFENNIFLTNNPGFLPAHTNEYNTFSNNVFTMQPGWGLNPDYNNYINVDISLIFVNVPDYAFSYAHNFHLQNPAVYIGVDATQCGLYGGMFGYKEGAVPVNPHIRQKTISSTTDASGNLNVNITVAAQNN